MAAWNQVSKKPTADDESWLLEGVVFYRREGPFHYTGLRSRR